MATTTREALTPYIRRLADLMGLRDWTVTVKTDEGPSNPEAWASCCCVAGRRLAIIRLSESLLRETPENQRYACVHELVHALLAPMDGLVEDWLDEDKYRGYLRMLEYGVDAIAEAWARSMPLPSETEA